jgi:hypothetical protein
VTFGAEVEDFGDKGGSFDGKAVFFRWLAGESFFGKGCLAGKESFCGETDQSALTGAEVENRLSADFQSGDKAGAAWGDKAINVQGVHVERGKALGKVGDEFYPGHKVFSVNGLRFLCMTGFLVMGDIITCSA